MDAGGHGIYFSGSRSRFMTNSILSDCSLRHRQFSRRERASVSERAMLFPLRLQRRNQYVADPQNRFQD
jgi:hypothetical protein